MLADGRNEGQTDTREKENESVQYTNTHTRGWVLYACIIGCPEDTSEAKARDIAIGDRFHHHRLLETCLQATVLSFLAHNLRLVHIEA